MDIHTSQIGAEADARSPGPRGAGAMFRALSHRNFRIFFISALLSNTGTWMQAVAQGWLVLKLTDSAFWLGMDGFMATAPGLLLTLAAGVFADIVDRRRMLLLTQIGAGCSALCLGILVASGHVTLQAVLALSFVTGCCMALAGPSYQAFTIDLVGRSDLSNAITLNSAQFQLSRAVGPAFAGAGFLLFGFAGCFFANAFSFIAVIVGLKMIRLGPNGQAVQAHSLRDRKALLRDLLDGFRYVAGRPRVSSILLLCFVTNLFGAPYIAMMPFMAHNVLKLNEVGFSVLMSISGAGALTGSLTLAFLGDFRRRGLAILFGAGGFALCIIGFALSVHIPSTVAFIFGVGFFVVCLMALANVLLQHLVTNQMRGRVMSMFILTFMGSMPVGNLMAGTAADYFGVPRTLAGGGVLIVLFVVILGFANTRLREMN